jgi:hypothetical protein
LIRLFARQWTSRRRLNTLFRTNCFQLNPIAAHAPMHFLQTATLISILFVQFDFINSLPLSLSFFSSSPESSPIKRQSQSFAVFCSVYFETSSLPSISKGKTKSTSTLTHQQPSNQLICFISLSQKTLTALSKSRRPFNSDKQIIILT